LIRVRISLDGLWDFYTDPHQRLHPGNLESAGTARRIRVPGPWQAQFEDLRDYSGVAWYRHRFEFPPGFLAAASRDATFFLHFGAVDYFTSVWLNGKLIGVHEGGYLPFDVEIGDALRADGVNDLVIRVIDPGDDADISRRFGFAFSEIPHGKQSWYGNIGGIWQSVYMEARHRTHLTRLHITPDVAGEQAQVALRLNHPTERPYALRLILTDPRAKTSEHEFQIAAGEADFQTALSIPQPLLWDTVSPNLYHLKAVLSDADAPAQPLDELASNFGMRSINASPEGHLMLNGRILYLRGALDQDYYPELVYTPFSDEELDEQFAKAKHMGLNCLRTHIKITDPRYYEAADRAGLLIWTELPNWQNLTSAVKERARETLFGMVERDWNHPSIVIWTIVNEGWGVDLAVNPEHRAWLGETYDYLKQLDPHRLVVGNSACFTNFHVVTDIEDFHNYYSIPDHYRQWRAWVESFAARPSWSFAHNYESITEWREFLNDPWNPAARTPAPEVRRRGSEPIVVSEFGNWGLPDVAQLQKCYGGRDPWWFETGIEWGEGAVYPHGVEQRFKTWHLDKVFPDFAALARASQHMQFCALKYQIEQMRRHPSIVGYIITEFTDVHWECNGLLDMCRNPKTFYDAIAHINSADAIVPDWSRISYREGETCEIHLALSHFSTNDLAGCKLKWHFDHFPQINGSFDDLHPERAQITNLGTISFIVPELKASTRTHIEFHLFDANNQLVTSNHQEFYFFPPTEAQLSATLFAPPEISAKLRELGYRVTEELAEADMVIVSRLTDEWRWYIQKGGRVLWMAETDDAQQTFLGAVEVLPRKGRKWQGDWASNMNWIRQDRMFSGIPVGGVLDFAFADLIPDHIISGLSPRDFAGDVHAGLFVGWLHHAVALVAERRFGNGRLLISTFRLLEQLSQHPVAAIMLRDMIEHLAGAGTSEYETEQHTRATPPLTSDQVAT
jgi:hypothetical protein